ncbi:hypothetical protein BGZ63DRAFT_402525 [Mariannaea sp. PMI_226]|nr:hypothetical protein BGZ63DRAFT_402525 [Mariannaea sp. PMI_226]
MTVEAFVDKFLKFDVFDVRPVMSTYEGVVFILPDLIVNFPTLIVILTLGIDMTYLPTWQKVFATHECGIPFPILPCLLNNGHPWHTTQPARRYRCPTTVQKKLVLLRDAPPMSTLVAAILPNWAVYDAAHASSAEEAEVVV